MKKITLYLNDIQNAIERTIKIGGLDCETIWETQIGDNLFRVEMTSICKDFPNGCIALSQADIDAVNDSCMIGEWIDFNYGDTETCAKHVVETISDYLDSVNYKSVEYEK